jgi:ribosome-binding factor A
MTKRQAGKGATQRQLRVGETIRHALSGILLRGDIADPDLARQPVTVTEVKLSPDLRHANIYVRPFGEGDAATLVAALKRHQRYLRGELAKHVDLKFMPNLVFRIDESFDEAERIDALLRSPDVARDLD